MRVTLWSLAVAVVLTAAVPVSAFPPVPPAKGDDALAAARKGLDEVADFVYQNRSLNDVKRKRYVWPGLYRRREPEGASPPIWQ